MRPGSFLVLAILVVLGALAVHAAVVGVPYKGQEADKGHVLVKEQGPFGGQHPGKGQGPFGGQHPAKGQGPFGGQHPSKGQGPFGGQHPAKGKGPVKTQEPHKVGIKPGTCPTILVRCAMMNPPNACQRDSECQGPRKCCEGSCGKACMTPH